MARGGAKITASASGVTSNVVSITAGKVVAKMEAGGAVISVVTVTVNLPPSSNKVYVSNTNSANVTLIDLVAQTDIEYDCTLIGGSCSGPAGSRDGS